MRDSVGLSDRPAAPPPEDAHLSLDGRSEVGTEIKPVGGFHETQVGSQEGQAA